MVGKRQTGPPGRSERPVSLVLAAFGLPNENIARLFPFFYVNTRRSVSLCLSKTCFHSPCLTLQAYTFNPERGFCPHKVLRFLWDNILGHFTISQCWMLLDVCYLWPCKHYTFEGELFQKCPLAWLRKAVLPPALDAMSSTELFSWFQSTQGQVVLYLSRTVPVTICPWTVFRKAPCW